jgi:hypothetical protein
MARVYRERVVEPRRELLKTVIERGIARGDLRSDTDVQVLHEFLLGPMFHRLPFSGGKLDRNLAARLVGDPRGLCTALRRLRPAAFARPR